jgi:hypothetical protein
MQIKEIWSIDFNKTGENKPPDGWSPQAVLSANEQ